MPVLKTVLWNSKNKTHTGFVSLSYTQAELHLWCPHPRSGFPRLPADIWKQILAVSLYFGRSIRTQEGTHSALVEGGRIMSSEVRELVKGPDHFPSRFLKWPLWLGVATKPPRSLQMREVPPGPRGDSLSIQKLLWSAVAGEPRWWCVASCLSETRF